MDTFLSRTVSNSSNWPAEQKGCSTSKDSSIDECEDSTDLKLATLASLFPNVEHSKMLDLLIAANGSVTRVKESLSYSKNSLSPRKRSATTIGYQSSLDAFRRFENMEPNSMPAKRRALTRKGQTLHLYSPNDISTHTPCSIIHNFLPAEEADSLLRELLEEAPTFEKQNFKLFDNVVQSPHSACFYVRNLEDAEKQKTEYLYNGSYLSDVRQITPKMHLVSAKVQASVNSEIATRIQHHYPDGKKLKYQSPCAWIPNAAFVNCYSGGAESVGYHSDQLTYLGPRAIIGSLSLGVAREFRIRKIVARDGENPSGLKDQRADAEGQVAM